MPMLFYLPFIIAAGMFTAAVESLQQPSERKKED
jgi:hypothetical protein